MTIAIVIGTHGWAAEQLLKTAEMLLGEQENVGWIDFVPGENAETLIEKYAHAEEISEELADAMIESMRMNGDNSLSIQFKYMDSFQAILDTVKILRKEVA